MEADPTVRKTKLEAALAKYRQLQSPDNVKLYQASLPADAGAAPAFTTGRMISDGYCAP